MHDLSFSLIVGLYSSSKHGAYLVCALTIDDQLLSEISVG